MGNSFNFVRVETPDFSSEELKQLNLDMSDAQEILGDQPNFGWAIPSVFRALANPLAPAAFPKKPDKEKDFWGAIAYWNSLQWFLIYRLGWAHPGKGLAQLYPQLAIQYANPEDNIKLLLQLWYEDGYLENFLIWAENKCHYSYLGRRPEPISNSWESEDLDLPREIFKHSPFELHLEPQGDHFFIYSEGVQLPEVSVSPSHDANSIVIVIDHAWGWYDALCRVAERNPADNYEVFVKTIGFMGKYHYSPETRLCYTGSHEIHLMGNVPLSE